MTRNNINLVKNSWKIVATLEMETVGGLFYNRLFELSPAIRPMFRNGSVPEQSRKLLTMLSYIIAKLDKIEDILDEVTKLARRHVQYGVTDDQYAIVGSALLWTLQKGLGAHWNDELAVAWTEVYTTLAGAMMAASKEQVIA
ncbi:MAG: globin domain-containing protein [Chitinophagaceae bacterium]